MGEPLRVLYTGDGEAPGQLAREEDIRVSSTASAADALARVPDLEPHCVVAATDFETLLTDIRERAPSLPVLLLLEADEQPSVDLSQYGPVDVVQSAELLVHRTRLHARQYREKHSLSGQNRLTAFMKAMPVGVLVADSEPTIRRANDRFRELFGELDQSWEGRPLSALFETLAQASTVAGHSEEIRALSGGHAPEAETFSDDLWIETDSGRSCYEVIVSHRVATGGYLVLVRDITSTKRREETLRERENELEQRTERLETQTAKLKYQNDRLDKFAGIVSHDLRNPLNVASARLELLAQATGQADSETIEQIRAAHERMEDIIDEALTLAREGKAITETEQTRLTDTAAQAWATVSTGEASLELCDPVEIESDPDRLQTIFENLFRNAVEHRADNDIEGLTVTVGLLDDGFYVEDTGPGIPDDHKEQVFTEGFSTNSGGTGFGLSIVNNIVRAHGWEITVTDALRSSGARFEITGVTFPLTSDDLVSRLAEPLGHKKAAELIDAALAAHGISQRRFDRETAEQILATTADRDDDNGLVTVAAETARRKLD